MPRTPTAPRTAQGRRAEAAVVELLVEHGLTPRLAQAFLLIARYGPLTATELSRFAGVHRVQAYRQATELRERGLVGVEGSPQRFVALPLGRVLERLEGEAHARLRRLRRFRRQQLRRVESELSPRLVRGNLDPMLRFQHLHGRDQVLRAYLRVTSEARRSVDCVVPPSPPSESDVRTRLGAIREAKARGLRLRVVTEITRENLDFARAIASHSECRHVEGLHSFRYFLLDDREVLLILTENPWRSRRELHAALWSTDPETVRFYRTHFESLFARGVPAERQLALLESLQAGRPSVSRATVAPVHGFMQAVATRWIDRFGMQSVRVDFTGSLRSIGNTIGRGLGRYLPRGDLAKAVRTLDRRFRERGLGRLRLVPGAPPRIRWESCTACEDGYESAGREVCPEILRAALRGVLAPSSELRVLPDGTLGNGVHHVMEVVAGGRPRPGVQAGS